MKNTKKLIRFAAVFLIFALTFISFVSCKSDSLKEADITESTTESVRSELAPEDRSALDDLEAFDFGGYEFKIANRVWAGFADYRLDFEELTGDPYNDAVFNRNRAIEDRFNVTITTIHDFGDPRRILLSGINDYDLFTHRADHAFTFAAEGLLNSIDKLKYIDLSKTYWNEFITNQMTIMNKKFFAIGSFNFSFYDLVIVLLFNKQLVQDYGLENPFDLVKSGAWTYDKFTELSKTATFDLNGDGEMDKNDAWGYTCRPNEVLPGLWVGGGVTAAVKDANDIPQNAMGTEKFLNVIDKIYNMIYGENIYFKTDLPDMFINGNVLFNESSPHKLLALRAMETDFGIIPYPKLDEKQENYYSLVTGGEVFFTALSASEDDLDRASIILEAMACESLKTCIPAYYDNILKTKLVRDQESEEIIDMLFSHRVFDWLYSVWTAEIIDGPLLTMFESKNNTLVSLNESRLSAIFDKKRNAIVEAFEMLGD